MKQIAISASHLTKTFGEFTAVNDVSFIILEGEIVGILGPNEAGKTTTPLVMRVCVGNAM
jgi:ABC-2 type transport system ATP-binding protein